MWILICSITSLTGIITYGTCNVISSQLADSKEFELYNAESPYFFSEWDESEPLFENDTLSVFSEREFERDALMKGRYVLRLDGESEKVHVAVKKNKRLWIGKASWYGEQFHGRKTASGTTFDSNGKTAAHRKLPFGTKLRVTNKRTGKSVVVTVTDRGPYSHNRELDLSKGAADQIGLTRAGVAKVKIEKI